MHVAYSREGGQKIYVQHLLERQACELKSLILNEDAHVYVCGDAHRMARDVFRTMTRVIAEADEFGGNFEDAENYLKGLKSCGRWLEDVW